MRKSKSKKKTPTNPKMQLILEYVYVIIGALIVAISFNAFLLPNQVASGGISGLSTILKDLFGWNPGLVQYAFNIPLFVAGLIILGKSFSLKSFVGTATLPFFVLLTSGMDPWTLNPLLGALFGGIVIGIGLGIVFRGKGSTGGTALAAQILTKYTGLSIGKSVMLMDGIVVLIAAFVFDIEKALYAIIALFVTTKTIDIIQMGFSESKMVYIISNKHIELRDAIYTEVNRGVTKLQAIGGYTEQERPILLVVVYQTEFTKLKQVVQSIDPTAFVIVSDAYEVLGEGFKSV